MARKLIVSIVAVGVLLAAASAALAAGVTASLFGGAVAEQSDVQLVSDLTDTNGVNNASGIAFTLPAGTTFADLKTLSTEFNPTVGGCGGGSPRFSIELAGGKNVFAYLGSSPSFSGCALNSWQSSGNLIGNNDIGRYDTSQVQAGTQSNTYAGALALVGTQQVKEIDVVVDAGWFFHPQTQTVLVRNVQVNHQTFFAPHQGGGGTGTGHHNHNPAQSCKTELHMLGDSAFDHKYGSNHNLHNALGKCVSRMAHEKHHN